jgi:hypothetical protein
MIISALWPSISLRSSLARGYDTRVFDPAGQDTIGGGCGQLWFVQDWMKENPDKAKPSVGFGKEQVHVPSDAWKDSSNQSQEAGESESFCAPMIFSVINSGKELNQS